jgi:capsid protein
MNALQRIKHRTRQFMGRSLQGAYYAITGQWEGYELNRYRNRPFRRLTSQDTDLDYGNREGLMSEARSLSQTFGIVDSILFKFANYCVGPCKVQFLTPDERWNELAESHWDAASKLIDYCGVHDMQSLARLAIMSEKRDGDIFFVKTTDNGFPQLKAVEADRVTNARGGTTNIDEESVVGGVLLNSMKVPVGYRVCERNRFGMFINPRDIKRQEAMHLYMPTRVDALRGVTTFKTALNHMRDIKETVAAWKTSVKAHSKISFIIRNMLGQSPSGVNLFEENTNGGEDAGTQKVEELGDGIIQYLMHGDELKTLDSTFPPEAAVNLVLLLIRDIAVGVGLPFEFVWNMAGLGGPATRMMSTQAQRTFEANQDNLERRFLNPTISWVTSDAIFRSKKLPFNPDWFRFEVTRPSHTTIDVGRESSANLAEHQRGVLSGKEIAEERGKDIFEVHAQLEREADDKIERAARLAKKHSIDLPLALSMIGNSTPNGNLAFQQTGGGETRETEMVTEK